MRQMIEKSKMRNSLSTIKTNWLTLDLVVRLKRLNIWEASALQNLNWRGQMLKNKSVRRILKRSQNRAKIAAKKQASLLYNYLMKKAHLCSKTVQGTVPNVSAKMLNQWFHTHIDQFKFDSTFVLKRDWGSKIFVLGYNTGTERGLESATLGSGVGSTANAPL